MQLLQDLMKIFNSERKVCDWVFFFVVVRVLSGNVDCFKKKLWEKSPGQLERRGEPVSKFRRPWIDFNPSCFRIDVISQRGPSSEEGTSSRRIYQKKLFRSNVSIEIFGENWLFQGVPGRIDSLGFFFFVWTVFLSQQIRENVACNLLNNRTVLKLALRAFLSFPFSIYLVLVYGQTLQEECWSWELFWGYSFVWLFPSSLHWQSQPCWVWVHNRSTDWKVCWGPTSRLYLQNSLRPSEWYVAFLPIYSCSVSSLLEKKTNVMMVALSFDLSLSLSLTELLAAFPNRHQWIELTALSDNFSSSSGECSSLWSLVSTFDVPLDRRECLIIHFRLLIDWRE